MLAVLRPEAEGLIEKATIDQVVTAIKEVVTIEEKPAFPGGFKTQYLDICSRKITAVVNFHGLPYFWGRYAFELSLLLASC